MKQEFEEHSKLLSAPSDGPMPNKQDITQSPVSAPAPQAEPATVPTVSAEATIESKQLKNEEAVTQISEKPQQAANEQQGAKQGTNRSLTKAENYLLSTDKRHYTLQLLGGSKEASLKQFIKKHGLEENTYSFHTKRQGKDWYIVVYGNYATAEEAKMAAQGVSENLKSSKIEPWVRDLGAVHKDIEQGQG